MTSQSCKRAFIIGLDGAMGSAVRDGDGAGIVLTSLPLLRCR